MTYQSRYTWQNTIELNNEAGALLHNDGSVSVMLTWDGFSTELKEPSKVDLMLKTYRRALNSFEEKNIFIENHFLRKFDNTLCKKYIEYGQKNAVRFKEFSHYLRTSTAETISDMAMNNQLVIVLTLKKPFSIFAGAAAKKALKQQTKTAHKLFAAAADFAEYLPGFKFFTASEIEHNIWSFYHREKSRNNLIPKQNPRFYINDRVAIKPEYNDGLMKLGDTYTKTLLLLDYPDADSNWFYRLANFCGCELDITQLISGSNAQIEIAKSAAQSKKAIESASMLGGENERGKLADHNDFRTFVTNNNLSVFNNAYIVKLHHVNPEVLNRVFRRFKQLLGESVVISDAEDIAWMYWRVSQLGQGHKTAFLRPDHDLQVVGMSPIIKFNEGDTEHPQMLRITSDAQAVAFSYPEGGTNHTVTAAKTGSGKGVLTVAQIAENYPLGTNYYIAEVGASYKWIVEAFGGTYFHLDPDETVISPFPDYSLATDGELPSSIISTTVGALEPLLKRGASKDVEHHIVSVSERLMQAMYAAYDETETADKAPNLGTFYETVELLSNAFEGAQAKAAKTIEENLHSFLSSTTGARFTQPNSLDFNAGIVGVDFKPLMQNEELAKFMLVFIALRYKQLAFANDTPTRILLDEQHEFSRIDHELIMTLNKQLTRMGRKEAGAYQGISQEFLDMGLEKGILNQVTHRELLFLQDGHKEIADMLKLNNAARARWENFLDPESTGKQMDYRQCLRMIGEDCYDLHLKFSTPLLDLAHSSPRALKLKTEIGKITNDPIERLKLFREAMEA